jgi:hypothetical protein
MSKIETLAANSSPDLRMLRDDEPETLSGGFLGGVLTGDYFRTHGDGGALGQIVSPRDPASGLPTGK